MPKTDEEIFQEMSHLPPWEDEVLEALESALKQPTVYQNVLASTYLSIFKFDEWKTAAIAEYSEKTSTLTPTFHAIADLAWREWKQRNELALLRPAATSTASMSASTAIATTHSPTSKLSSLKTTFETLIERYHSLRQQEGRAVSSNETSNISADQLKKLEQNITLNLLELVEMEALLRNESETLNPRESTSSTTSNASASSNAPLKKNSLTRRPSQEIKRQNDTLHDLWLTQILQNKRQLNVFARIIEELPLFNILQNISDLQIMIASLHYLKSSSNRTTFGKFATAVLKHYTEKCTISDAITLKWINLYETVNACAASRRKMLYPSDHEIHRLVRQTSASLSENNATSQKKELETYLSAYILSCVATLRTLKNFISIFHALKTFQEALLENSAFSSAPTEPITTLIKTLSTIHDPAEEKIHRSFSAEWDIAVESLKPCKKPLGKKRSRSLTNLGPIPAALSTMSTSTNSTATSVIPAHFTRWEASPACPSPSRNNPLQRVTTGLLTSTLSSSAIPDPNHTSPAATP